MSNAYCTLAQLYMLYDERTVKQLSNDQNSAQANETKLQFVLDVAASYLDTIFDGRETLPASIPLYLTKLCATQCMKQLYERRTDMPKSLAKEVSEADKWIELYLQRKVNVPGGGREQPGLVASGDVQGRSQIDNIFDRNGIGRRPSSTTTSGGESGYGDD
jgi:phage gp36-like protein